MSHTSSRRWVGIWQAHCAFVRRRGREVSRMDVRRIDVLIVTAGIFCPVGRAR
jgi:hypothetical protein